MARDANGTNKTLLQLVAGQASEQDAVERVKTLEEELRARDAELAEERRLNRQLTTRLLLESNEEKDSARTADRKAVNER